MYTKKFDSKKSVIFLPDYINKSLVVNSLTLSDIDNYSVTSDVNIGKRLKDLSTIDIHALKVVNDNLSKSIFGGRVYGNIFVSDVWDILSHKDEGHYDKGDSVYLDVLNSLSSKDGILVSDNNISNDYTFDVYDNTVFVIMHKGFTDFTVYSNEVKKNEFILDLVNVMFKMFGEKEAISSAIFGSYIRSIGNKDSRKF